MTGETIIMANGNRCTVYPQHLMVNTGRSEALCGDLYRCACGESSLNHKDEGKARAHDRRDG